MRFLHLQYFSSFILLCLLGHFNSLNAQVDIIKIKNPSFEGKAKQSEPPKFWRSFNLFKDESPPDTQPGIWGVKRKASDGDTYIGIVVRDVETHEAVSQRLKHPLMKSECYSFKIDLCRSNTYLSMSQITGDEANYTEAVKFRIWGYDDLTNYRELLAESEAVDHQEWKRYNFEFSPKDKHYKYIVLEAYFAKDGFYNGHILIDNASDIIRLECDK
ncbi:MAG: hypothetical protein AAGK97_09245 [Bacteroidota bacterium]